MPNQATQNCEKCGEPLTPLTTVIPNVQQSKEKLRKGMIGWRACYPCNDIIRIKLK